MSKAVQPLPTEAVVVGVDVAKAHLDVYVNAPQRRERFANDAPGITALAAELRALAPAADRRGGYRRV